MGDPVKSLPSGSGKPPVAILGGSVAKSSAATPSGSLNNIRVQPTKANARTPATGIRGLIERFIDRLMIRLANMLLGSGCIRLQLPEPGVRPEGASGGRPGATGQPGVGGVQGSGDDDGAVPDVRESLGELDALLDQLDDDETENEEHAASLPDGNPAREDDAVSPETSTPATTDEGNTSSRESAIDDIEKLRPHANGDDTEDIDGESTHFSTTEPDQTDNANDETQIQNCLGRPRRMQIFPTGKTLRTPNALRTCRRLPERVPAKQRRHGVTGLRLPCRPARWRRRRTTSTS